MKKVVAEGIKVFLRVQCVKNICGKNALRYLHSASESAMNSVQDGNTGILTWRSGFSITGMKPLIAREKRSSSVVSKDRKAFAPFEHDTLEALASKL